MLLRRHYTKWLQFVINPNYLRLYPGRSIHDTVVVFVLYCVRITLALCSHTVRFFIPKMRRKCEHNANTMRTQPESIIEKSGIMGKYLRYFD